MEKYLQLLNKIKEGHLGKQYVQQLERIESYVKGEITSQELINNTDKEFQGIVYYIINKLLNYEEREVRYYFPIPKDINFNTGKAPCIATGKTTKYDMRYDTREITGPEAVAGNTFMHGYIEITGDFSQYPNGVMLFNSDWYRIWSKYPYLHEFMYSLVYNKYDKEKNPNGKTIEQIKAFVDTEINKWKNKPKDSEPNIYWIEKSSAKYLPQEVIDSIEFIIPTEYLSPEEVVEGNFRTFEELVKEKNSKATGRTGSR